MGGYQSFLVIYCLHLQGSFQMWFSQTVCVLVRDLWLGHNESAENLTFQSEVVSPALTFKTIFFYHGVYLGL